MRLARIASAAASSPPPEQRRRHDHNAFEHSGDRQQHGLGRRTVFRANAAAQQRAELKQRNVGHQHREHQPRLAIGVAMQFQQAGQIEQERGCRHRQEYRRNGDQQHDQHTLERAQRGRAVAMRHRHDHFVLGYERKTKITEGQIKRHCRQQQPRTV